MESKSLLRAVSVAPPAKIEVRPLIPTVRFPDGYSRRLTEAEWQDVKKNWGRPVAEEK